MQAPHPGILNKPGSDPVADFAARFAYAETEALLLIYHGYGHDACALRTSFSDAPDRIVLPIRQIVIDALRCDSRSIILAHNHPSGEPRPSRNDIDQTRRLAGTLEPLDIDIYDHVIVARSGRFSFRDAGLL
jgi:DNA repair protein RadC